MQNKQRHLKRQWNIKAKAQYQAEIFTSSQNINP